MAELEKESLEQFGWPIFTISSVAHEGLDELRFGIWEIVKKYRSEHPVDEEPVAVLRPEPVDKRRGKLGRKSAA
ncbi:hypothetical protein, partial [Acinetobacter pittii]